MVNSIFSLSDRFEISKKFRTLRESKSLTQERAVEELNNLGCSISVRTLQRAENCELFVDIEIWVAVAKLYDVSLDYLLGISNDDNNEK